MCVDFLKCFYKMLSRAADKIACDGGGQPWRRQATQECSLIPVPAAPVDELRGGEAVAWLACDGRQRQLARELVLPSKPEPAKQANDTTSARQHGSRAKQGRRAKQQLPRWLIIIGAKFPRRQDDVGRPKSLAHPRSSWIFNVDLRHGLHAAEQPRDQAKSPRTIHAPFAHAPIMHRRIPRSSVHGGCATKTSHWTAPMATLSRNVLTSITRCGEKPLPSFRSTLVRHATARPLEPCTGPARLTRVRNWRHACWPHRPSSASGHSKGVVALVKARRLSCLEF